MKIIKYLFLLVLVLLFGAAAYIALLDDHFSVEKHIELEAPRSLVFEKVSNLESWESWALSDQERLQLVDSEKYDDMEKTLSWSYDSLKVKGELSIAQIARDSFVEQKAVTTKNINRTDYKLNWSFKIGDDSLLVNLRVEGHFNYWSKIDRLLTDSPSKKWLSKEIENSLLRLKNEVRQEMSRYAVHVDGIEKTEQEYYLYRQLSSKSDIYIIHKKYSQIKAELENYIAKKNLEKGGRAFVLFENGENGRKPTSIGIPLADKPSFTEEIGFRLGYRPALHQVKSTLKGNYDNILELWALTENFMTENDLEQDDKTASYLVFKKTPNDSENPADWVTEIFIPLKEYQSIKSTPKINQEE